MPGRIIIPPIQMVNTEVCLSALMLPINIIPIITAVQFQNVCFQTFCSSCSSSKYFYIQPGCLLKYSSVNAGVSRRLLPQNQKTHLQVLLLPT